MLLPKFVVLSTVAKTMFFSVKTDKKCKCDQVTVGLQQRVCIFCRLCLKNVVYATKNLGKM